MPGIVLHRPHFRGRAQRIRYALGGALIVRGEADPDMAIVEDGVVLAIGLLDLVQRLGDQKGLEAIACHESQCALEEIEPPQRGELIQHQQDAVPLAVGLKFFG